MKHGEAMLRERCPEAIVLMPKGKSTASGIGGKLQERKEKQELTAKRTKLTKFFADPAIRVGQHAAFCMETGWLKDSLARAQTLEGRPMGVLRI